MSGGRFENIDGVDYWLDSFFIDVNLLPMAYMQGTLIADSIYLKPRNLVWNFDNNYKPFISHDLIDLIKRKSVWFTTYSDVVHQYPYNGSYAPDVLGFLNIKLNNKILKLSLERAVDFTRVGLYIKLKNAVGFVSVDTLTFHNISLRSFSGKI